MSLLPFVFHDSVTGIKDYLEKLKDFAVAQGWTQEHYLTNVQWQIGGFVAGSEDFLQLSTTGFGGQSIFMRFRTNLDGGDTENDWLEMGAHKANTFDNASSIHPVQRDVSGASNWNSSNRFTSYHPTSIPQLWIFGNDKFIFSVAKHSTTICVFQMFGSLEHFDTTQTQGDIATCVANSASASFKWYTGNVVSPFDHTQQYIYYDNGLVAQTNHGFDFRYLLISGNSSYSLSKFATSGKIVQSPNAYSERRAPIKQRMYIKDVPGDSLWWSIGTCWIYRFNVDSLAIGEEVTFGTEKYLCFPNPSVPGTTGGFAVRVA